MLNIKVAEIIDNPDGSATVTFEITDEFKKEFKKLLGLKRFSQKAFQKFVLFVLDALSDMKENGDKIRKSKKH